MKTPRFWYERDPGALSSLMPVFLSPLALFFQIGAVLRRALATPYRAPIPVLCVGNAVAGGAGKTPVALALARILKERGHKPVFVTRGYGGCLTRSGNPVYVDPSRHSAADVGDEALLLASVAPTWAGADRVVALRQASSYGTCVVMDDGMQNPHVSPAACILVVDGESGIGNGHLMPSGPLREPWRQALSRAAVLVIVGGEGGFPLAFGSPVPVFRAALQPDLPLGFPKGGRFVAFAGIARPAKFYATARKMGLDLAETVDFPDHHPYNDADIDGLRLRAEELGARLITTAKDAVRLPPLIREETIVLPVSLVFQDAGAEEALGQLAQS